MNAALAKTGIRKPATLHTLRHSFAAHLLEQGTDLRYIQTQLGYASNGTTEHTESVEVYAHVSRKALGNLCNRLDDMDVWSVA